MAMTVVPRWAESHSRCLLEGWTWLLRCSSYWSDGLQHRPAAPGILPRWSVPPGFHIRMVNSRHFQMLWFPSRDKMHFSRIVSSMGLPYICLPLFLHWKQGWRHGCLHSCAIMARMPLLTTSASSPYVLFRIPTALGEGGMGPSDSNLCRFELLSSPKQHPPHDHQRHLSQTLTEEILAPKNKKSGRKGIAFFGHGRKWIVPSKTN